MRIARVHDTILNESVSASFELVVHSPPVIEPLVLESGNLGPGRGGVAFSHADASRLSFGRMSAQRPTVPPVLLPEILEFSPQLLLDDIINSANEAITNAVDGLEEFLFRWAADREQRVQGDWDSTQDVEQGLVAFQTLLEYHTDIAFDFFETWSLRNIFAIPADLPIVAPHHAGLVLDHPPELETQLMAEIRDLRKKIDAVGTTMSLDFRLMTCVSQATSSQTLDHPRENTLCSQSSAKRKSLGISVVFEGSATV